MQPFEAMKLARERGLDLVEISPTADPPVCKITDYGKYLYQANKKAHCAHFVAFAEEPQDLVLANLIIVFRGGGPKLDFLQLRAAAAFALLMSFFVGLVKIFAVVGDLANGRISRGRDFHQVEPSFPGQLHGLKRLHDAQLTTLFINPPDFASPDSFVDANAVALPEAAFCDKSPSSTSLFPAAMRPAGTNSPGSSRVGPNS